MTGRNAAIFLVLDRSLDQGSNKKAGYSLLDCTFRGECPSLLSRLGECMEVNQPASRRPRTTHGFQWVFVPNNLAHPLLTSRRQSWPTPLIRSDRVDWNIEWADRSIKPGILLPDHPGVEFGSHIVLGCEHFYIIKGYLARLQADS